MHLHDPLTTGGRVRELFRFSDTIFCWDPGSIGWLLVPGTADMYVKARQEREFVNKRRATWTRHVRNRVHRPRKKKAEF